MLTGSAKILESYVRNRFQVKVRSVELNVNQRCSSLLASAADVDEAILSGRTAVKQSLKGATGCMVSCSRADGPGYRLEFGLTDVGNPLIAGEPERIMENGLPRYISRESAR